LRSFPDRGSPAGDRWYGPWRGSANLRVFSIALFALITAFTVVVFVWLGIRTEVVVGAGALEQARAYTDLIVAARAWNSLHGGVYVKKSATALTNPYLVELGVSPDATLTNGTPLTLRNPAAMTREIGDQLRISGAASVFKLTSLAPVNPDNAPDEWERGGLTAFDRGASEYWATQVTTGQAEVFRYMRPLRVDESCLGCHDRSKYKVGDNRGAISVTLPHGDASRAVSDNRLGLAGIGATVLAGLWIVVFGLIRWLERKLAVANERLERMATVDALTELWNRRAILERLDAEIDRAQRRGGAAGVVMIDIDHFKRVNDAYGHAAGDEVLRRTADAILRAVRAYDSVGRVGGEEVLVVVPDIDETQLADLAERIRLGVETMRMPEACAGCVVTISAGTALMVPDDVEPADALVARADKALYEAKAAGRNRVVAG